MYNNAIYLRTAPKLFARPLFSVPLLRSTLTRPLFSAYTCAAKDYIGTPGSSHNKMLYQFFEVIVRTAARDFGLVIDYKSSNILSAEINTATDISIIRVMYNATDQLYKSPGLLPPRQLLHRLVASNLPYDITEADLQKIFSDFGSCKVTIRKYLVLPPSV